MRPRRVDPVARERRGIELLRIMGHTRFVLIGGYAVSSYGLPRFSVDLDIVVRATDVEPIRALLRKEGLDKDRDLRGVVPSTISFEAWSDGLIGVDLLIDEVVDRRSGAIFPIELVERGASNRLVSGRGASVNASVNVAAPETLLMLKLCAGRLVDLRDVAILSRLDLSPEKMKRLASAAPRDALLQTTERLERALLTREFKDSLKGEFMMKERRFEECVASTRRMCETIRGIVSALP